MKKLEKSSQNKKSRLVFIYGPIATGKLTVSKELQKVTGYKLFDNHSVLDTIFHVISGHTFERDSLRFRVIFDILETALKQGEDIIMTHAYGANYVSPCGLSDPDFVKKLQKVTQNHNGFFCPVYVFTAKDILLERSQKLSREKYKKLTDLNKMKDYLKRDDITTPAPIKSNLFVDNTNLSPKKVARMIQEHFDL